MPKAARYIHNECAQAAPAGERPPVKRFANQDRPAHHHAKHFVFNALARISAILPHVVQRNAGLHNPSHFDC